MCVKRGRLLRQRRLRAEQSNVARSAIQRRRVAVAERDDRVANHKRSRRAQLLVANNERATCAAKGTLNDFFPRRYSKCRSQPCADSDLASFEHVQNARLEHEPVRLPRLDERRLAMNHVLLSRILQRHDARRLLRFDAWWRGGSRAREMLLKNQPPSTLSGTPSMRKQND